MKLILAGALLLSFPIAAFTQAPAPAKDKSKLTLKPLVGTWEGLAYFGTDRYLVKWDIQEKGFFKKSYSVSFLREDYRLHLKKRFSAELTGGGPGIYQAQVVVDGQARVQGTLLLGRPKEGTHDRAIVLTYDGLSGGHELRFTLTSPDKLDYEYLDLSNPGASSMGEISRAASTRQR